MNKWTKTVLGAGITFPLCGIIATPNGDPFTMVIVGSEGAVITFFLLWWTFSRRAALSWSTRRQIVLAAVISACVTLTLHVAYAIPLLGYSYGSEARITSFTLRDTHGAGTTFHGYYVADGLTNNVRGTMPANFNCSARSFRYEFVRDQSGSHDVELVISISDGSTSLSRWQQRIRGHCLLLHHEDGSDERREGASN